MLFLLLLAVSVLAAAPARAEMPEPGERERQWELGRAYDTLRGLVDTVMEFARTAQAAP